MLSFEDLKKAAHDKRRKEMVQQFKNHPLTKIGVAVATTVVVRIASDLVLDKIEERMDKKKEIEE